MKGSHCQRSEFHQRAKLRGWHFGSLSHMSRKVFILGSAANQRHADSSFFSDSIPAAEGTHDMFGINDNALTKDLDQAACHADYLISH